MSIEMPDGGMSCPPGGAGDCESGISFAKFSAGAGIESLILEDAHFQRKTACMLRKSQREQRRKLVKEAVKKLKEAADSRFYSALLGIGLKIGAAGFECLFGDRLTESEAVSKGICKSVSAVADGLAAYNPFETDATDQDCEAKLLQDSADGESDAARDTTDWLASARELERRAIDHLGNITSAKHKTQLTASGG